MKPSGVPACRNGKSDEICNRECRCRMTDLAGALDSLLCVIAFDNQDYGSDRRLAWIYGIVCGWDDASWAELKEKFRFPDERIADVNRWNAAIRKARGGKT